MRDAVGVLRFQQAIRAEIVERSVVVAESVAPRSLQSEVRSFVETARDLVGSAHLEIRAVQGVDFKEAIEDACHCERAIAVSGLCCDEATNLAEPALDNDDECESDDSTIVAASAWLAWMSRR